MEQKSAEASPAPTTERDSVFSNLAQGSATVALVAFVIAYVVAELGGHNQIHFVLLSVLLIVGVGAGLWLGWTIPEGEVGKWVEKRQPMLMQVLRGYAALLLTIPIGLMLPTHALPSDELMVSFLVVWVVFFTAVFYDLVKGGTVFDPMPWFKWISIVAIALLVIVAFDAAKGWGWF